MLRRFSGCGAVRGDLTFGCLEEAGRWFPVRIILAHPPDSSVCLNMGDLDQRFLCRSCLAQARADAASAAGRIALGDPYAPGTRPIGPLAAAR